MKTQYIEAGRITNTHGLRGEVKIEVWLDSPAALSDYPRVFIEGREYRLLSAKPQKQFVIAALETITDVSSAMTLKGKSVFIARDDERLPEGGYFLQGLLGAKVVEENGSEVGVIEDILERPASEIYIVRNPQGREILIPAVPAFILKTDADAGIVMVHLLEGM